MLGVGGRGPEQGLKKIYSLLDCKRGSKENLQPQNVIPGKNFIQQKLQGRFTSFNTRSVLVTMSAVTVGFWTVVGASASAFAC
jgi:hypothetical protein